MTAAHPYRVTWHMLFTLSRCPLALIRKVHALQGRGSETIAGMSWMTSRPSKCRACPLNMANHLHSQARRRINYEVKCVYRSHNPSSSSLRTLMACTCVFTIENTNGHSINWSISAIVHRPWRPRLGEPDPPQLIRRRTLLLTWIDSGQER